MISNIVISSWHLLRESSIYIIFGLVVSGFLKTFLDPSIVVRHLGKGRFISVFKAAFLGIPIPLCSCGVIPAALSLKKQGANKGATTAFMISTPESGIDSIAITYALLDPIMTVARPLVAFITASAAGITENLISNRRSSKTVAKEPKLQKENICDTSGTYLESKQDNHIILHKISTGLRYAFQDFWSDLAGWFLLGIVLAGAITALIPEDIFTNYLGSGLSAMLFMLVIGIPLYICATASTPIAAALILKGISPGAALVFLLAGPATNIATLTVLVGALGKRTTAIYLFTIAICSVGFGLVLDQIYGLLRISAGVTVGQESEIIPSWIKVVSSVFILAISVKPVFMTLRSKIKKLSLYGTKDGQVVVECGDT